MRFRIALVSPDSRVASDAHAVNSVGVGGAETSRVLLLQALARLGHEVTAYVHTTQPGIFDGVMYRTLDGRTPIDCDVLIASSVDPAGFSRFDPAQVTATLRIVRLDSALLPKGIERTSPDVILVPSNFLRDLAVAQWGYRPSQVLVVYNGLPQEHFVAAEADPPARDPYAIAFIGHPRKGLESAFNIITRLRTIDSRFCLDVFGGFRLWDRNDDNALPSVEGATFKGMVGQRELAHRLYEYGFVLAVQRIRETFGIAVQEAKRAGAIVVASNTGAFTELIRDRFDGFLVPMHRTDKLMEIHATNIIRRIIADESVADAIRANARTMHWSWDLSAASLAAFCEYRLTGRLPAPPAVVPAVACPGTQMVTPGGIHCIEDGTFHAVHNGRLYSDYTPVVPRSVVAAPRFRRLLTRMKTSVPRSWRQTARWLIRRRP
jgi:glycosyltransferase involved in cell wall biosynthesis